MKAINWIRKILLVALLATGGVALVCPLFLYWVGLYGIDGRPNLPEKIASKAEQQLIWKQVGGGETDPSLTVVNPYTYFSVASKRGPEAAGLQAAWRIARSYNLEHKRYKGMGWWHLSGAALTIWLTRNWSIEQLLSKEFEAQARRAPKAEE